MIYRKTLRDLSLVFDLEIIGQEYEPAALWAKALRARAEREFYNERLRNGSVESLEKASVGGNNGTIE